MGALNGRRVLLVEDEAMVAMMVEDMLADLGCVVVEVVGSLARGLEVADGNDLQVDCALLDVNLGGETVYPLAEALMVKGVPLVFSTGYGAAGIPARYGAVPLLAKPYTLERLEKQLVAALAIERSADGSPAGGPS